MAGWLKRHSEREQPPAVVPRHIAIIMDGNGRWARRRGLPRSAGHRAGLESLRIVLTACIEFKVAYLTIFSFSTENWSRPTDEIDYLMSLFAETLTDKAEELNGQGVRLNFVGRRDRLPRKLLESMESSEKLTAGNKAITLSIAIDYGARDEILRAVKLLASRARDGGIDPGQISEADFANTLYTGGLPDPDLLIRTSGEQRLSNFLLWQSSYAEFWFTPTLWPDFGRRQLLEALSAYAHRERRYGRAR